MHDELKASFWQQKFMNRQTWQAAVIEYFNSRPKNGSWKDDVKRVKSMDAWLRYVVLDDIDQALIRKIRTNLKLKNLAPATINRYLNVLGAILHFSVQQEWLDQAPVIRRERVENKRLEFLTPDEVESLLNALNEQVHRDFVVLAIATGLRMRNLTHLEWEDVDLFRKTITIYADQIKSRKTTAIPINNMALKVLKRLHKPSGRVLLYRGKPLDSIGKRAFKTAQKRAGLKKNIHPHLFRHTFASWHIQSGTSLPELKDLGGWSKIESVMIYAHLNIEHLQKSAEKIQQALKI